MEAFCFLAAQNASRYCIAGGKLGINHRTLHVIVAEKFLHGADVIAAESFYRS